MAWRVCNRVAGSGLVTSMAFRSAVMPPDYVPESERVAAVGGGPIYDQFQWPLWAERVLGRKVTARNFNALLDELAAKGDFAAMRDGVVVVIENARLGVLLVEERIDAGVPTGQSAQNFLALQKAAMDTALRASAAVSSWAKSAVEKASEAELRPFALDLVSRIGAFQALLPRVIPKLVHLAFAVGFQLGEFAAQDFNLWEEIKKRFREFLDGLPKVGAGLGWLVLGVVAVVVAGSAVTRGRRRSGFDGSLF